MQHPGSPRLAGKVAIVTGGGTGLGRAIALRYAEEGARIVIGDVRAEPANQTVELIEAIGGEAVFVATDVTDSGQVQALVATAESRFGRLDIMTANAGILGRGAYKRLVEIDEDEADEIMNVNFGGVFRSFKYAIPAIRRTGGGAMTATASLSAHRGKPDLPVYAASKGAVVALVRSLAVDLAPEIRVNAVSPGAVLTELAIHTAEAQGRSVADAGACRGDAGPAAREHRRAT